MQIPSTLPFVVHVDDCDDPADVIDTLLLGGFVAGSHPVARTVSLQRVRADAPLLPRGTAPVRLFRDSGYRKHLVVGEGWILRAARYSRGSAQLTVVATSDQLAEWVISAASADAIEPAEPENHATISFWHLSKHGGQRIERSLAVDPWPSIRENYSLPVACALDQVITLTPGDLRGRLLLFHGPPGTGKTTLLRALALAWRDWCRLDYVLDPDRLLRDSSYLMHVLLDGRDDDDDDDDQRRRWRLLVLEDCDELIRADAKENEGQSLARLLNLTDGLVGQGLEVLVCITTNEELVRLHPAITRPGRCFAHVHVGRLSRAEASAWLDRDADVGPDGATLAELYALRGDLDQVEQHEVPVRRGLYL